MTSLTGFASACTFLVSSPRHTCSKLKTYRGQDGVHVRSEIPAGHRERDADEDPAHYRHGDDAKELRPRQIDPTQYCEKRESRGLTETGIHTNCAYPHSVTASTTLHSPTPRYRSASQRRTGTPMPYEYTSAVAMESSPKSYSSTAAAESGCERYAEMEDASEEHTKSAKMSVVSVQKGPYRSALGVRCAER